MKPTDSLPSDIGKRLGNVSSLPEELRNQLQAAKTDVLESQIINVISGLEDVASIDEILVWLYRKYNVIQERMFLANKLYRMTRNGSLVSIKGKKGIYRIAGDGQ